ncbi:MAG TPA: hypothetical protein VKZ53_22055 [Candidatus Angelobacter sp.]|nr:hypothetical protein [Candidatus Angelobacter sp.]
MRNHPSPLLALLALVIVFCVSSFVSASAASTAAPAKDQQNASQAFDKLKALAGTWEASSEHGKSTISYEVIAHGTSLIERIHTADKEDMATVYHLDGDRLVLTHYCEAGNQPEMTAAAFDPESNEIRFNFARISNLSNPNAGHMHSAAFHFDSANQTTMDWKWYENGKEGFTIHIQAHRVR